MSTTNILDLNNRIDALEKNSGGGSADSAKRSDIATEFSTETSYTAGNFVYYEGKLYQFNADHSAGAWDPTDVVEANVTDQIVSNKSAIDGLTASDVAYDNTDSGLTATDVQGAVDELRQADNIMLSDGVTSVEDALDEVTTTTSLVLSNSTYLYENGVARKKNGVVCVTFNGFKALTNNVTTDILNLIPSNMRPSNTISVIAFAPSAAGGEMYRVKINNNGTVSVYPYTGISAQNNLNVTLTYVS